MDILDIIRKRLSKLVGTKIDINSETFVSYSNTVENLCCDFIIGLESDVVKVKRSQSERSIDDIQVIVGDDTYNIDITTYDMGKEFSLPSLISIDKCRKFLSIPTNHIIYVIVGYTIKKNSIIRDVKVQNIESLDWSYLSIQNIGKGQLQIKSFKEDTPFNDSVTRDEWLKELIKKGTEYYDGLILKVAQYKQDWEK